MTIALVTSIFGDYDTLRDPPEQDGDVEYVAVVDRIHEGCSLWRQVVETRPHLHPRMAAKVAKCRPDLYTDADVTVWVDGSARILRSDFAEWAASHVNDGRPLAQFPHHERNDVYVESEVSARLGKYGGQPMLEQVAHYRKEGLPRPSGLWAGGIIARSRPGSLFGSLWLLEQARWTFQDQLSEPWVLWQLGLVPVPLEGGLVSNPYVGFNPHPIDR